jgi:Flp pilus assembly protein TadD
MRNGFPAQFGGDFSAVFIILPPVPHMNPNADKPKNRTGPAGRNSRLMDSFDRSLKLAFEMQNAGRGAEAESLCRVLMKIRPQDAQLLFLLGMVLHKAGRDEEAVEWLSLAAQYQPQSARIFSGLGCAYQKLEDHPRAAAAFEKAKRLEPQSAATDYNLGNTCYKLGQIQQAESLFRSAVEKDPRDSACWNNLGKCLKELNRLDESIEAYNRALEIAPDYALARYGRAVSLLTAGRYPEGFRDYEWRWLMVTPRQFRQPEWSGNAIPGQTLLLHAEQGFGDAIQMVRFIPAARERVGRVILECRPELQTLFQYSKCADTVIPYGVEIPPFDCRLSLISLPRVLGVTLDTIPNRVPYLRAPVLTSREPDAPSSKLQAPRLKVGLAWAGNPEHHQDAARSLRLEQLAPVLQVLAPWSKNMNAKQNRDTATPQGKGVAFYNLQQPIPAGDQACLQTMSASIHSNLKLADFLDTASVIAEMDLVIAVDTAVAHLAGALGKPVWILLQHSPDWRWLLDRPDSRWYPTARLFRQVERNEWKSPVLRVAEALNLKIESVVSSQ